MSLDNFENEIKNRTNLLNYTNTNQGFKVDGNNSGYWFNGETFSSYRVIRNCPSLKKIQCVIYMIEKTMLF